MKKKLVVIVCFIIGMGILSALNAIDNKKKLLKDRIDVYYLHNTFRCMSCNTIENLTKAAILGGKGVNQKYKSSIDVEPIYKELLNKHLLTFQAINIDDKKDHHLLKIFKANAKYPIFVKIKDDKIIKSKVLKDAWNLMGNNKKFIEYIQKNLNEFMK